MITGIGMPIIHIRMLFIGPLLFDLIDDIINAVTDFFGGCFACDTVGYIVDTICKPVGYGLIGMTCIHNKYGENAEQDNRNPG